MRKIFLFFSVLLLLSSTLKAQTRTVSGTVTDEKSEPVPGVTIQVKGSNASTATDADGKYSIKVTDMQTVVITVKFIGYAYQERAVAANERNADFKLVPSTNDLNEVVVVGYGEQKKIDLTGAVATIDTKQIQDIPVIDLASALRGQVAGVSVSGGTGRPQANVASVSIRNPVTFVNGAVPPTLYVIDDVIKTQQDFNALDQSEVESISVLKDAAAAIYGIQGANGAIIVRTKRGKIGAPKVSYSGSLGLADASELPKMMNGYQLATYLNYLGFAGQQATGHTIDEHGYIDGSSTKKLATYYSPDELAYFQQPENDVNFLKQAFKTAATQRHSLNISGGNDKVTYYGGASYVTQNSNFTEGNTGFKADRWSYRASVNASVANGLKVAMSLNGYTTTEKKGYFKQGGENQDNDFKVLLLSPPFTKYYVNGLPNFLEGPTGNIGNTNNLADFNYFYVRDHTNDYNLSKPTALNINPTITYEVPFIKGLKLTGNYNREITNTYNKQVGTNYLVYQFAGLGENNHIPGGAIINSKVQKNGDFVRLNPVYNNDYQLTGTVNYTRQFGKHNISLLGLYEQEEGFSDVSDSRVEGVIAGGYDNQNFANGAMTSTETVGNTGRQAYAGRLNYNYADKYLLEALIRRDGSVKFAPGHRWGTFSSVQGGWVVSEENFFKNNVKFMDFLKIRASLGLLGKDNVVKAFQYAENYNFGQTGHGAVFGGNADRGLTIFPNISMANSDVTWDDDTKINLGLDMQFLSNRLGVTVDAYQDYLRNMLAQPTASTPFLIGVSSGQIPTENNGSANVFGYELSVSWKDRVGKDISYYVSPFLSWNDNKILKKDQQAGIPGTWEDVIGGSADQGLKGFKTSGFFRTQAEVDAFMTTHPNYTIYGLKPAPGMLYYQDIRGQKNANAPGGYDAPDGIIDDNDKTFLTKHQSNHYSGGFNFGGSYKNFTLQVITSLSWGGVSTIESDALSQGSATANRPNIWAPGNYWTPETPNALLPSPYYMGKTGYNNVQSDFWLKSSFQFRMTNLNLSYAFPKNLSKKFGVADIRIYANMVNPFNFYNPFDYRDNGVSSYLNYPTVKTYTFGLNVGF